MSDNHDYLGTGGSSARVRADGLALMMKGAGYALVFCLAIWIVYAVIVGIGRLLPDESRERPDPTPLSYLVDPAAASDLRLG